MKRKGKESGIEGERVNLVELYSKESKKEKERERQRQRKKERERKKWKER